MDRAAHRIPYVAAVVGLLAAGCSESPTSFDLPTPLDPSAACTTPDVSIRGWQVVDRAAFSFRVPPGFRDLEVQPVDSDVMVFELGDGDAFLTFDLGIYTRELADPDCRTEIGGRGVGIRVLDHEGETFVVARWPELGSPSPSSPWPVALLMTGRARNPAVATVLLAAVHSVRFE